MSIRGIVIKDIPEYGTFIKNLPKRAIASQNEMVKNSDQYHEINYKQYLYLIKEEPQEGIRLNRRDEKVKSSCGFGYFLTLSRPTVGS
jgi:hypothetical protein